MKNILFLNFFFFVLSNSIAQNIYIKPILGSQHGLFKFHNPQSSEYFEMNYKHHPFNWQIDLYAGIALEYQKDEKQRFELSYSSNSISRGYDFKYYDNIDNNSSKGSQRAKSYGGRTARNLSFNYARVLFDNNYGSGRRLAFEGIIGGSYLSISKLFYSNPSTFLDYEGNYSITSYDKDKRFQGAAISLGFASRFYTIKGKPALEVRFQYSQGLTYLGTRAVDYEVRGEQYSSETTTRGSMMSISLGVPIRIFNLNKRKNQE